MDEAEALLPIMFLVIIFTITIYGLSAIPLAKWLGISSTNPQGCVIIGANPLGKSLGLALKKEGIKVLMVDTNWSNISSARMEGLPAYYGSILSDNVIDDVELNGIGKLLAVTPNNEVNALGAMHFSKVFGSDNVYQLSFEENEDKESKSVSKDLRAQMLFGNEYTYFNLINKINNGMVIKSTLITEKFNFESFINKDENIKAIPLMIINDDKEMTIYTKHDKPKPDNGETLISLVEENKEETS